MQGQWFKKSNIEFDKILVDAPCSGTGTIRKSLKTLRIWNPNMVKRLSITQKGYNLLKELKHLTAMEQFNIKLTIFTLRQYLDGVLIRVYDEGTAEYNSKLPNFDQSTLELYYKNADFKEHEDLFKLFPNMSENLGILNRASRIGHIEGVLDLLVKIRNSMETQESLFLVGSYPLGFHMVYTIKYALLIDDDELFSLSLAKFIKLYEEACNKVGIHPLITLTSGRGKFLDYKNTLRMLHRAERA